MAESCSRHPDRASDGVCVHCGGQTCVMCKVDVDGVHYCSIICFTEATLATKRKNLREPAASADPLAHLELSESPAPADPAASLDEPSIVLGAQQAESQEESSLLVKKEDASETSILDMGDLKRAEESSILQMKAKQDHTSILGMSAIDQAKGSGLPSWLDEPPQAETPLPMVLPGTRRTTIESICVFHKDTPAIVRCSRCGDSICTLCVTDEAQGGRCSPSCRRDLAARARMRLIRGLLIGTAAVVALFIGVRVFGSKKEEPPKLTPPVATAEADAKAAEAAGIARATEEARARVKAREREEEQAKAEVLAKMKAAEEAEARANVEERAKKAKALEEAEARMKAEALAKEKADAAAKAAALAKLKAAEEAEARAKAEAIAKAKAEALAKMKAAEEAEARAKAEAAKAEALAKSKAAEEAEARAKAEALAKAEAAAKAEALAKAKALEEAEAREKAKRAAIESALTTAALRIREAAPLYEQLAGRYQQDAEEPERASQLALASQVRSKLAEAQTLYRDVKESAPSPERIATRIKTLAALIESLDLVLQGPPASSR